jgi:hypothetical protein
VKNIWLFGFLFEMMVKAKNSCLYLLVLPLFGLVILQSACNKDKENFSREDFANALKGNWFVITFQRTPSIFSEIDFIQCDRTNDSLKYRYINTINDYQVNDPIVCTLPEIENIQDWTITKNNDEVTLNTIDLCDNIDSYTIEYDDIIYEEYDNGFRISADVNLIGTDTTWQCMSFYFSANYLVIRSTKDSLAYYDYVLSR